MVRYFRMKGRPTLWIPGTDHAGIATQLVVENMLAAEGIKRTDLTREEFTKKVWEWKEKYGSTITNQIRRLGASCDWSREHFTLDEQLSRAVVEAFVRLHDKGLIYQDAPALSFLSTKPPESHCLAELPALPPAQVLPLLLAIAAVGGLPAAIATPVRPDLAGSSVSDQHDARSPDLVPVRQAHTSHRWHRRPCLGRRPAARAPLEGDFSLDVAPRSGDGVADTVACVNPGTLEHVVDSQFDGRNWAGMFECSSISKFSKAVVAEE